MNKNKKRFISFALILTFSFVLASFSAAQDLTYIPKLNFSGEYNDNILYTRDDKIDDFIFNITPGLELRYASELMDLRSFAAIRFRQYLSESDFDREDYIVNLQGRYRMTERLRLSTRLSYVEDYTLETRIIDFTDPPIEDVPIDEAPVDEVEMIERGIERFLSERKQYNAHLSMNHRLTPLSNLNISYRYLKTDYDLEQNTDYDSHNVNLAYMRRLSGQKDQIGTRLGYRQRTSDVSDTDSYEIGLIWNHIFTETISIFSDLGVRYTEQTFKDTRTDRDNWNAIANIRLRKRGETGVVDVGLRQNIQTASTGETVNVSRLYWFARQALTERVQFELSGDFYITREDADSFLDSDSTYFDIIPTLRYLLTENHSVRLAYNYTIDHDRTLDSDRDKQRNRIWIMFDFGFPGKW